MAVGVVAALRSDGIAQVALGVEHRQRAEPGLHEQLRRIAELDRAGTGILPAGDGIDLIAEAKVLRALRGVPRVIRCLIVAVFQMHPAARVEVGDALALGHRHRVLVLADGQDDLSLVHLIWHMASFLCGLIVSNMYSWGGFPPFQQPAGRVENPPAIESVENRLFSTPTPRARRPYRHGSQSRAGRMPRGIPWLPRGRNRTSRHRP